MQSTGEKNEKHIYKYEKSFKRLCERFPQLMFHKSKVRSNSDTVYTECLSPANVAESFIDNNRETSQSSQDSDLASEIAKRIWKQA